MRIAISAAFVAAATISASAAQTKKKPDCIKWGHEDHEASGLVYRHCGKGLHLCVPCRQNDATCQEDPLNTPRVCMILKSDTCKQGECETVGSCCGNILAAHSRGWVLDYDCADKDGPLSVQKCQALLHPQP